MKKFGSMEISQLSAITWLRQKGASLLVLCLFIAGIVILYRTLHHVDINQVRLELHSMNPRQIMMALLCTIVGYIALVGYDWSALRYINRHLSLPIVAFTSFIGYALSNTIGVSWLSGGAVRYRIYSRVGLSGKEIAMITAFCTLGFGIGEVVVGGAALSFQPDMVAEYLGWSSSWISWCASILLSTFLIVLLLRSRHSGALTWRNHTFQLPNTSILVGQIIFSLLDIGFAGATLYMLLPDANLSFLGFLSIFAIALVIGILSHVPGGVGVFEAVMMTALAPFCPLEKITAALVLYRLIYYITPFLLGILLLIVGEVFVLTRRQSLDVQSALSDTARVITGVLSAAAPIALSGFTFMAGVILLLNSSIPVTHSTLELLDEIFPVGVVEVSHWFGGLCGAMLIIVSYALWQRIRSALWLTTGLLFMGAVISLIQTLDYDRTIVMLLGLTLIYFSRDRFYRRSRLLSDLTDFRWLFLTMAAMACFIGLMLFSFKHTSYQQELWWQFAIDAQAPRAMRTTVISGVAFTLFYLLLAIRAPKYLPQLPSDQDLECAASIIANQDNPDANFAFTRDKALMFSDNKSAFVMFDVRGQSWVSMGDPVSVNINDTVDLIWNFKALASRNQRHAAFYQISKDNMHHYIDANFSLTKLGEEAIVELNGFGLEGRSRNKLRQAHNRAKREGLNFQLRYPPHSDSLLDELQSISDEWLSDKGVREKGFSLGFFDKEYLQRTPLALVIKNEKICAFANVLVTNTRETSTIDLMRHNNNADNSAMDFLFIELMLTLKEQGYTKFSLGMAPLSGLAERDTAPLWDRFGMLIYKRGKRFYNFQGLRKFKEKFDPIWEPRYLATTRGGVSPYLTLADIAALTSGGVTGIFKN